MALTEQELQIEEKMRKAFWQRAKGLSGLHESAKPTPKISNAGGEIELFLFQENGALATDEQKYRVLEQSNAGVELGAAAVEIHPSPVDLQKDGFDGWLHQLREEQTLVVLAAKAQSLFVGRSGTIPWVPLQKVERTNEEKYQLVPAFHDRHRSLLSPMKVGNTRLHSASEVGGINSFQFSIQAVDAPDAVDKLQRMFLVSPFVSALSSNSRILAGNDSGWADTRFEIWRQTHDTRTARDRKMGKTVRVGLPQKHPETLHEYLEEVSSHPFILDKPKFALEVGIGLSWRDARIKIIEDKYVVEFRPISTQPTIEEDLALAAFSIGRILWSQKQNEQMPNINTLHQNKIAAEKFGIHSKFLTNDGLRVPIPQILLTEISHAETALKDSHIFDETAKTGLEILRKRVISGITPDQKLRRLSPSQLIESVKIL